MKNILLWLRDRFTHGLTIRLGRINLVLNVSWLLIIPLSLWVIATIYIPIMGSAIDSAQVWGISFAILVLILLSLFLHVFTHLAVTKVVGCDPPEKINPLLIGDPAQCWPAAPHAGKEAFAAFAGPLSNGVLAALFYFLWNWQINTFISIVAAFMIFWNLALMLFNFIPAFPFDGGRIVRAAIWWLLGRPRFATRLAYGLGWGISVGLIVWGIVLIVQQSRFSLETAIVTFIFSALILGSLALQRGWKINQPDTPVRKNYITTTIRSVLVFLILLPQVVITLSLVPLNDGLEAPGITAPVAPMVQLPSEYRHDSTGKFVLTTVISQAPILFGEWLYAHLDDSIQLKPPEEVVPEDKTHQSISEERYRMLLNSEETAVIMGLRLAGYNVTIHNDGIIILSVLPDSLAKGILQENDIIVGVNGNPVVILEDLTGQLDLLTPGAVIGLTIKRDGQITDLDVTTIATEESNGHARIGISIMQHNSGYTLPFPIGIVSQKILGGPSAGLMFTLGVYDMLTEEDLTGGRIIAGTGTIDLEGKVGAIGGVRQKIAAAERADAEYFFSPSENYADALAAATHIKVIKVDTVQEAVDFLRSLPPLEGNEQT